MSADARRPERKRHTTMKEVADLAGVSQTTVSFVINRVPGPSISKETHDRVWDAVKQLGYRRNAAAKTLRTSRSHSIGFVTDVLASSPFAGEIIRGAQECAWADKQLLMIVNTGGDPALEEAAVEALLERRIEGITYASMSHHVVDPPRNLRDVPAVLLNCFCADRSLPSVTPDEVGGGVIATEALLRKGHRRIGFINLDPQRLRPPSQGRLQGYRQALATHGVAFDDALVRYGNANADDGYRYTLELLRLSDAPTALFCGTDRMAMGAYDAVRDLGLSIPQDVAIVGFDNQELISQYLRPALSTVALPFVEMGRWAARYLTEQQYEAEDFLPVQHMIACSFVERASM
jgi:LacI family transcriptional regulator